MIYNNVREALANRAKIHASEPVATGLCSQGMVMPSPSGLALVCGSRCRNSRDVCPPRACGDSRPTCFSAASSEGARDLCLTSMVHLATKNRGG